MGVSYIRLTENISIFLINLMLMLNSLSAHPLHCFRMSILKKKKKVIKNILILCASSCIDPLNQSKH